MGRLGLVCHQLMPCVLGKVLCFTGGTGSRERLWEPLEAPASSSPAWREGLPRGQTGGMGMGQVSEACGPLVGTGGTRCVC